MNRDAMTDEMDVDMNESDNQIEKRRTGSRSVSVESYSPSFDLFVGSVATSIEDLKRGALSAVSQAEKEAQQLADDIDKMVADRGGRKREREGISEYLQLNVGGRLLQFPWEALFHPVLHHTPLAQLLLHFTDALPRDADGRPFIDVFDAYIDWLADQVAMIHGRMIDRVELEDQPEATDPAFSEPHSILMTQLNLAPPAATAAATAGDGSRTLEALKEAMDDKVAQLREVKLQYEKLMDLLTPFLRSGDEDDDTVVSVTVLGKTVSTVKATLNRLGREHPLYNRFNAGALPWSGSEVRKTSSDHFRRIVDFARRQRTAMAGTVVKSPVVKVSLMPVMRIDCGMYNMRPAEVRANIASASEMDKIARMTGKGDTRMRRLYKLSRDGKLFTDLLGCVGMAKSLLLLIQHNKHRFGCWLEGPLEQPDDPRGEKLTKCPMFFVSISGAYDHPTRIDVPANEQRVSVAGTETGVMDANDLPRANMCIATGRLWIGFGRWAPSPDVRSVQQWVERELLGTKYRGEINPMGNGTLAEDDNCTVDEIEIWKVGLA
ncbi:unnamed protein product [Vitrella brassicaformis CCMP3155]|uniref:TLDc domain-containing protein n=2 Tax=Vitrella brassicaformis TaxID=1169539 RepID=A0A0G4FWJ3_VITBC|nr:unnamed protein product [Vitrella brassicaformis CCMP3155]|eukprot:CEM19226.1 unnamed protein product [Vitrella brassicaformis CCMP3155]